jgi:tetratricopeptide (TPR) repeat protein
MTRRQELGTWVTAIGLLLAGCATPGHKPGEPTESSPATSEKVDQRQVEAHAHYAQALILDMENRPEEALEEYSKAALADPSNEDLVEELTHRYLQQKQPEKALEVLSKASSRPGATGAVFAQLGMVYSRLGKETEAIQAENTAIRKSPKLLSGYQNLCIIHLQGSRSKEALKVLDDALKVPDTDLEFLTGLGGLYVSLERQAPSLKESTRAGGLTAFNRAAKLSSSDPQTSMKLADGYGALGDTTNASRIYLDLLERYGELPLLRADLHSKLADIYLRGHDPKKATEQLEAIVQDDPSNAQAYYLLGAAAYDQRRLPEAVRHFQKSLLLNDDFEQAYYDLAGAQIALSQPNDALATLDRARGKFARSFLGEYLAAVAGVRLKDFTNAVSHFTSAESLARASEPERLNAEFYFETGAAQERKGDFDQAEQYFEKSLKLAPQNAEALNYYGYMLADRGVKLEKAHDMIDKAVKQEPDNAAFVDSLGWVLFKLGKPEEALPHIKKALDLSGDPDATIYDHLGDIYSALKQPDKATEAWRKSLSIEPNDDIRRKLERNSGEKTMR